MSLPFTTEKSHTINKEGRKVSLSQCLLSEYGTPRRGWSIRVALKGSFVNIEGRDSFEVFRGLRKLADLNDLGISDEACWLNLNILWFQDTPEKYHLVDLEKLLELALPAIDSATDMTHRNYPPAIWGSKAWDFLGCYLAGDTYDWVEFHGLLKVVLGLLNPISNPSIGSAEAHISLLNELNRFDMRFDIKPLSRVRARIWLVNYHNSVNVHLKKQKVSFDTAAKKYLWT